jgi:adenosylcobinamide-GDP ribazoletransferase
MSSYLSQAWRSFAAALMFLTRLPLPSRWQFEPVHLQAAYFPFVGLCIGGFAALIFALSSQIWSPSLAVLISMVATIWATGAFHEDGFADSCDGFGGGWDKQQILRIMQDSRLGTYGCIGLMLILAVKFLSLQSITSSGSVLVALLLGHSLSRLLSISHLYDLSYVRFEGKSKPVATSLSGRELGYGLFSIAVVWLFVPINTLLIIFAILSVWRWWFTRYMQRWIGGYTGDCLGASQQVSEVLIYLILAAQF